MKNIMKKIFFVLENAPIEWKALKFIFLEFVYCHTIKNLNK